MTEISLAESTIDEIAALVETSPLVRAALFQGGHRCLQMQSGARLGRHFTALDRRFELLLLKTGKHTTPGVYQVMAEGTYRTSAWNGEDDDQGRYKYGAAPVAYLNRHRLFAITQRHLAVATPPPGRIAPGRLYAKLTPGQSPLVDPDLAHLLHTSRDLLEWSRTEFAENFQTSAQMVKNWELLKPGYRIPHGIWPPLVEVLKFKRTRQANDLAREIEEKAMGGSTTSQRVNPRPEPSRPMGVSSPPSTPLRHATPLPIEVVRQRAAEAVDSIQGATTSRYMRGYQEEQRKIK